MKRLPEVDVVIVGAGWTGLLMAKELGTRSALKVAVLERGAPHQAREFVDGWASVGFFPRVVEALVIAPLVLLPLRFHLSTWGLELFAVCLVDLFLVIALNGYLGVMIASVAPDRQAARCVRVRGSANERAGRRRRARPTRISR